MANYKGKVRYYTPKKPRMDEWQALELLPAELKKCLMDSVQPWSAIWILKYYRKAGLDRTINALRRGDKSFCEKGFIVKRGRGVNMPSSYVECKVEPLRANW